MSGVFFDHVELCQRLIENRRVDPYGRAIEAAMTPGAVVADIGPGLGLFTLFACRAGARKVYAIDALSLIHLAREVITANGYADRVEFIQSDIQRVVLPERADIVVCDARNILPEFQLESTIEARRRLLVPGGTLIPRVDRLSAAIVESPAHYGEVVGSWTSHPLGIKAETALRRSTETWIARRFTPAELVSTPAEWTVIDYTEIDSTTIAGACQTRVTRRATGHGLCVWFESELAGGFVFSSRPTGDPDDYGTAFFPWPRPMDLEEGDQVSLSFEAHRTASGHAWRWRTFVCSAAGREKASFDQRMPNHCDAATRVDAELNGRCSSGRQVSDDVRIDRDALEAIEHGLAVGVVADRLLERFPAALRNRREALTRVGRLSARYD